MKREGGEECGARIAIIDKRAESREPREKQKRENWIGRRGRTGEPKKRGRPGVLLQR